MPYGHHITHCSICGKEYICGDCITSNCELGRHAKRECPGFKQAIKDETELYQDALKEICNATDPERVKLHVKFAARNLERLDELNK